MADGELMAAEVKSSPESFEHSSPELLFRSRADAPTGAVSWSYMPSPDGQRFLIRTPAGAAAESPALTVVVNWPFGAKR
jgi:hypothetical protein